MKYIILLVVVIYAAGCKNCENRSVAYTVQEPYETTETRNEKLKYHVVEDRPFYNRTEGAILIGENPKLNIKCNVANESNAGGEFVFYATLTCQGDKVEVRESKYIPANSIGEFLINKEINPFSFKSDISTDEWGIIAPIVEIKENVTKYKDVIKYKLCNTCDENCP